MSAFALCSVRLSYIYAGNMDKPDITRLINQYLDDIRVVVISRLQTNKHTGSIVAGGLCPSSAHVAITSPPV